MHLRLTFAGFVYAALCGAAQPDYFPLETGNQWVLEAASAARQRLNIEVLRSRVHNGETYYLVSGYATRSLWLRKAGDGTLYALEERRGTERALAQLVPGAPAYETRLGECKQQAQPAAQPAPFRGPEYQTENALAIDYAPGECRDAGLTREVYAPGIGLVRRSVTTIAGELTFELVYARVNGAAVPGASRQIVLEDDFATGSKGWLAGFSDYSLDTGDLRMLAELRPLPQEAGAGRPGFYIQSMNRSDDLFMFLKKHAGQQDGLEPNRAYRVAFEIRFASDAQDGCAGAGGSPGDSVYLKAGGSVDEPVTLLGNGKYIALSADKGQQAEGGRDAGVVGTIANGTACDDGNSPYVSVRREFAHPTPLTTDDRGSLWLLVGTDSAFEGLTGLYFESITVRINPWAEPATP